MCLSGAWLCGDLALFRISPLCCQQLLSRPLTKPLSPPGVQRESAQGGLQLKKRQKTHPLLSQKPSATRLTQSPTLAHTPRFCASLSLSHRTICTRNTHTTGKPQLPACCRLIGHFLSCLCAHFEVKSPNKFAQHVCWACDFYCLRDGGAHAEYLLLQTVCDFWFSCGSPRPLVSLSVSVLPCKGSLLCVYIISKYNLVTHFLRIVV